MGPLQMSFSTGSDRKNDKRVLPYQRVEIQTTWSADNRRAVWSATTSKKVLNSHIHCKFATGAAAFMCLHAYVAHTSAFATVHHSLLMTRVCSIFRPMFTYRHWKRLENISTLHALCTKSSQPAHPIFTWCREKRQGRQGGGGSSESHYNERSKGHMNLYLNLRLRTSPGRALSSFC
jgi:hypothetical protein